MLKKIGFFGLSHLGICYSAAYVSKGFKVVAVDNNKKLIEKLRYRKTDIYEPGLKKIINSKNLLYTQDLNKLNKCDLIFYSKDVETNEKNISNKAKIKKEILNINKKINKKIPFIILSQVQPGFTRSLNLNRQLFYQVETLIFGQALHRALHPERIIIGKQKEDTKIPKNISAVFKKFSKNIVEMNYETAELSKISINLMLISSIMTSNMISLYCENINANWSKISEALRMDKRIGKNAYLNPSPGLSGGNLERDLMNSKFLFNYKNIINSWIDLDKKMKKWAVEIINKSLKKKNKILISGIAYKNNTLSTKNSLAIYIANKLINKFKINIHDKKIKMIKNWNVNLTDKNINLNSKFDCIIFVNQNNKPSSLKKFLKPKTIIIDPYGFFKDYYKKKYYKYYSIGNNV